MQGLKYRLNEDEVAIIVMALIELRNRLIAEDRCTDPVDEILTKLGK